MAEQFSGLFGYVIAVVAGVAGFYFWRQCQSLSQQYKELLNRNHEFKEREKKQGQKFNELKEDAQEKAKTLAKLEKELNSANLKLEQVKVEEEGKRSELEHRLGKTVDQLEHYQAQTKALTEQLQEIDADKREFRLKWEQKLEESQAKWVQEKKAYDNRIGELKKELRRLEAKANKAEEQLRLTKEKSQAVDPLALKKIKSRIHQYHHLYQIMRGHKEMAEERNRNWELALRILSNWILKEKAPEKQAPDSLGSLVAAALETIKHGPLMEDDDEDEAMALQEAEAEAAYSAHPGPLSDGPEPAAEASLANSNRV